jgi:Tannase and feruloyl esterase
MRLWRSGSREFVHSGPLRSVLLTGTVLGALLTCQAARATGPASCDALSKLTFPEVTSISAQWVTANTFTAPAPFPGVPRGRPVAMPFCRVRLTVAPQIHIEVWLPEAAAWNHRFEAVGGGGYAGTISYSALAAALTGNPVTGHFATASTDTGHPALGTANGQGGANGAQAGGGFALDPQRHTLNHGLIVDFASRSLHESTEKAKAVIGAYYGTASMFNYWNGCSTGGRQGLMEAQRFPADYDGILAGAPAINWDRFVPASLWPAVAMKLAAGHALDHAKLEAVTAAAIHACDALDGVRDGVIDDPLRCRFDPHSLQCGTPGAPSDGSCLSAGEATAVRQIWDGARGPHETFIWYGLEPGTQLAAMAGSAPFPISLDHWRLWIEQNPGFDWRTLDLESFGSGMRTSHAKFHEVLGTDSADLAAFRRHGGKLIMYHGWTDQLIFPRGSINYWERVLHASSDHASSDHATSLHDLTKNLGEFYRLFMVPGMNHCFGGPGAVNFGQSALVPTSPDARHDVMVALQRWVEHGVAPDELIATTDPPSVHATENPTHPAGFTRVLCPFPQIAAYQAGGNPDIAASFRCTAAPIPTLRDPKM